MVAAQAVAEAPEAVPDQQVAPRMTAAVGQWK